MLEGKDDFFFLDVITVSCLYVLHSFNQHLMNTYLVPVETIQEAVGDTFFKFDRVLNWT